MAPAKAALKVTVQLPRALVADAHGYAIANGLPLKVVLTAALAEYLAKRNNVSDAEPAPQLHYSRGRPSAEVIALRAALMRTARSGRKLRPLKPEHSEPPCTSSAA